MAHEMTDAVIDAMVKDYIAGKTLRELSRLYGPSVSRIHTLLNEQGVSRTNRLLAQGPSDWAQQMVAMHKQGVMGPEIAKHFGVPEHAVYQTLVRLQVLRHPLAATRTKKPAQFKGDPSALIDTYLSGLSVPDIGVQFACSDATIYQLLKHHKVMRRNRVASMLQSKETRRMVSMFKVGMSFQQISDATGLTKQTIVNRFARLGLGNGKLKRTPAREVAQVLKKYHLGQSLSEIAKEHNTDTTHVARLLMVHGGVNERSGAPGMKSDSDRPPAAK